MSAYKPQELTVLVETPAPGGAGPSDSWAGDCARLVLVDGVAISSRVPSPELLWHSADLGAAMEDLQSTLDQGPSIEAARDGSLHMLAGVARVDDSRRPAVVPGAIELGVRTVFAFPLRSGAIRVGSLTGYRREPHPLSEEGLNASLAVCEALTHWLLSAVRSGTLGTGNRGEPPRVLHRAVVHQATGMLSVQLDVDLATALDRLRAYAFARNRPLVALSRDIVAGRLRLPDDRRTGPRDA
ncbi:ANTAR domain-containing protein [Streptomyces sp. NPDC051561]|uniref:ANTAR domain-containing protein n=1 Tax=Streptomyces sp. NPDC051561 TaxID=3365658 RepID=UPI003792FD44